MDVGIDIGSDSRPQEVTVDVGSSVCCTEAVLLIMISCERGFPDWFVQEDTEPFIVVNQSVVNIVCWESFGIGDNWGEEFVTHVGHLDSIRDLHIHLSSYHGVVFRLVDVVGGGWSGMREAGESIGGGVGYTWDIMNISVEA